MRSHSLLLASIGLTVLCWGLYGPVLQSGQAAMSADSAASGAITAVCVRGIGVLPDWRDCAGLWLHFRGEKGEWTLPGIIWSLAGGALGAIGALGIILAFTFGGRPIYVMPLVFGGAPVVNAFLTIYMARRVKEIGPLFLAALIIVILGAVVGAGVCPASGSLRPNMRPRPVPRRPQRLRVQHVRRSSKPRVGSAPGSHNCWQSH